MNLHPAIALAALGFAACDAPTELRVDEVTPPYAPLVGGTRVTITGSGFGAGPTRVLVGGREAPLVATTDETSLDVVVPAGAAPGPAELIVLTDRGNTHAAALFHYSTPPAITAVSPARVLFDDPGLVTVTGTGFRDEGAGDVFVVVDGQLATDVEVASDTTLTFTAPPGRPLVHATIELVDGRGRAVRPRAFRYAPSTGPGLLLFPTGGAFAVFYDPATDTSFTMPWITSPAVRFTAVLRDDHGDYWALDRSRRYGRIDARTQRLESPISAGGWFPAMVRAGDAYYAIERGSLRFGRFEPASGAFTPIGDAQLPCCGSYGLAWLDDTLYLVARADVATALYTIDPSTGALGPPLPLVAPPGFHVEDLRAFAGTLHATTRAGNLATIDPATGNVTVSPRALGRFTAMEVYP